MGRFTNDGFAARRQAIFTGELCEKCARSTGICADCRNEASERTDLKRRQRKNEQREVRFAKENGFSL